MPTTTLRDWGEQALRKELKAQAFAEAISGDHDIIILSETYAIDDISECRRALEQSGDGLLQMLTIRTRGRTSRTHPQSSLVLHTAHYSLLTAHCALHTAQYTLRWRADCWVAVIEMMAWFKGQKNIHRK